RSVSPEPTTTMPACDLDSHILCFQLQMQRFSRDFLLPFLTANRSKRSGKSNSVSVSFTKVQNRLSRSLRFSLVSRAEKLTVCSFLVLISRTRGQLSRT